MRSNAETTFERRLEAASRMAQEKPRAAITALGLLWNIKRDARVIMLTRLTLPRTSQHEACVRRARELARRIDAAIAAGQWDVADRLCRAVTGDVTLIAAYTPDNGAWAARLNAITAAKQARA
jgi:hypothetical protein